MTQPGRNDPCPCGSGLKYKKCCLGPQGDAQPFGDEIARLVAEGYKFMSLEQWDQAIECFKAVVGRMPEPSVFLEAIAACYDGLENYLLAAEYYEKALAECPESRRFRLTYFLGIARACAERIDKAVDAFSQCLELGAEGPDKEMLQRGIEMLTEIKQGTVSPATFRVEIQLQRALTDMDAERYDQAAYRLEQISRVDTENPAISYNLGVVYTFLKREDEALTQFQKCTHLDPGNAPAWYNMGQISMIRKRDFARALHCFDRAAAIRPEYIGAHHQRGVALELLGDRQEALKCWHKTLELDPENRLAKDNIERVSRAMAGVS